MFELPLKLLCTVYINKSEEVSIHNNNYHICLSFWMLWKVLSFSCWNSCFEASLFVLDCLAQKRNCIYLSLNLMNRILLPAFIAFHHFHNPRILFDLWRICIFLVANFYFVLHEDLQFLGLLCILVNTSSQHLSNSCIILTLAIFLLFHFIFHQFDYFYSS